MLIIFLLSRHCFKKGICSKHKIILRQFTKPPEGGSRAEVKSAFSALLDHIPALIVVKFENALPKNCKKNDLFRILIWKSATSAFHVKKKKISCVPDVINDSGHYWLNYWLNSTSYITPIHLSIILWFVYIEGRSVGISAGSGNRLRQIARDK